jgi:hypothetical protein
MSSPDNQDWLNKCWDYIVHFKLKDFDYYDNSIKMLNMIILSGNYWTPGATTGGLLTGTNTGQHPAIKVKQHPIVDPASMPRRLFSRP